MGAVGAALVFGFADALQNLLTTLGASPSRLLLMAPYVVTIIAVAGVGRRREERS